MGFPAWNGWNSSSGRRETGEVTDGRTEGLRARDNPWVPPPPPAHKADKDERRCPAPKGGSRCDEDGALRPARQGPRHRLFPGGGGGSSTA